TTPASVRVGLNAAQFVSGGVVRYPPGSYSGSVNISATGVATSPISVPVTLTVTGSITPPRLDSNLSSIAFNVQNGAPPPTQSQTLSVTSASGPAPFSISGSTATGGAWLAVSPAGASVTPAS